MLSYAARCKLHHLKNAKWQGFTLHPTEKKESNSYREAYRFHRTLFWTYHSCEHLCIFSQQLVEINTGARPHLFHAGKKSVLLLMPLVIKFIKFSSFTFYIVARNRNHIYPMLLQREQTLFTKFVVRTKIEAPHRLSILSSTMKTQYVSIRLSCFMFSNVYVKRATSVPHTAFVENVEVSQCYSQVTHLEAFSSNSVKFFYASRCTTSLYVWVSRTL